MYKTNKIYFDDTCKFTLRNTPLQTSEDIPFMDCHLKDHLLINGNSLLRFTEGLGLYRQT